MKNIDYLASALENTPHARKKPKDEEHRLQVAIVQYMRLRQYQNKDFIYFAVPNGGWRNPTVAAKLKAEGVRAGVSDLIIIKQGKVFFVELKTPTGKQSDSQKIFEQEVKKQGFDYLIWRSVDDCIDFFVDK